MRELIIKENNKFVKNNKNKFIIIIMAFIVIFFPFISIRNGNEYYKKVQLKMESEKNISAMMHSLLTNTKADDIDKEYLSYLNEDMKRSLILEHYYKEKDFTDWRRILKTYNDKYKNIIYGYENNFVTEDVLLVRDQEIPKLKASIFLNNYLLENDIEYEINPYELSGKNFLLFWIQDNNNLIILAIFLVLSIDSFYLELEGDTYKTYYTQPYKRNTFFGAKIYRAVVLPILIIMIFLIIGFIIISTIFKVGNLSYPNIILSKEILFRLSLNLGIMAEFQAVSTSKFLFLNYLLFFIIMIFFASLSNIIILFTDSLKTSLVVIISLLIFNNLQDNFISKSSKINFFFPTEYINSIKVLGETTNTSYFFGLVLLTVLTFIILIVGMWKFGNKDMIGGKN